MPLVRIRPHQAKTHPRPQTRWARLYTGLIMESMQVHGSECLIYVKSLVFMYASYPSIGEAEEFGFGDGLDLQDFAEDGVLYRAVHSDQRDGFGAAGCLASAQGEGGDVYA
jgi:hypothetical protein